MRWWVILLGLASVVPAVAVAQSGVPVDEEEHHADEDVRRVPVDEEEHRTAPGTEGDDVSLLPPGGGPTYTLSPDALDAGSDDHDEEEESDEDVIVPPPPHRAPSDEELDAEEEAERAAEEPDGEPSIIDEDMELVPDPPDLPQWRLRAGAGVGLPTAGDLGVAFRATQDFEWQPHGAEPFLFGLGGSENLGAGLIGQAHARVGLHAWFCEALPMRCQAAVAIVAGAAFGLGNVGPDVAGEADLRLLFWDTLELHVRGGFFTLGGVALIDITGGVAVAF